MTEWILNKKSNIIKINELFSYIENILLMLLKRLEIKILKLQVWKLSNSKQKQRHFKEGKITVKLIMNFKKEELIS